MLLLFIGGITATTALYTFYRVDTVAMEGVRQTSDVLATTKTALIGYAVRGGRAAVPAERPGELPCPDTSADTDPDSDSEGIAAATCISGAMGRVPWKTLGIPKPTDSSGETLWYVLSGNFRTRAAGAGDINSDTRGTITVRAADNATLVTDAVAVIISPGASQGAQQNRGKLGSLLCGVLSLTINRTVCPTNYLETLTINAITRSVTAVTMPDPTNAGVNDRVMYISTPELISAVEMRVAGEVRKLLEGYRANSGCQCYPWADTWEYSGGIADNGQNRGRFPTVPVPHAWGTGSIPAMPAWLESNDWHNLIWYSVAKTNSAGGGQLCRTCSSLDQLAVTGQSSVSVVFFTPGTPLDAQPRLPPGGSTSRRDALNLYLQDSQNTNGSSTNCPDTGEIGDAVSSTMLPGATSCDTYVRPTSTARDRDRMYTLTSSPPSVCAASAQVLTDMGPCRLSGSSVNAMCTAAANQIAANGCTCQAAAQTMITSPCKNNHNPSQCQAAIAALNACST